MTTLYRLFNSEHCLLYVGISAVPPIRFKQHASDKPWWTDASHVTLEHYPDRTSALNAERQAILTEHPLYNITHNGRTPAGLSTERATMPTTTDRPDRLSQAVTDKLQPDSLIGSFFHTTQERGQQGCVVAEPAPGVYLLELFEWFTGSPSIQILAKFSEMMDWQFYDTAEWMANTYEHVLRYRWEAEADGKAAGEIPRGTPDPLLAGD